MSDRWADPEWRRWKVETVRRSLAMISNDTVTWPRQDAERMVNELQRLDRALRELRDELRRLADQR